MISSPSSASSSRSLAPLDRLEAAASAAATKRDLYTFIREAWHVVEPGRPLADNWHLGAICEHLQAVTEGQIRKLVINIPPRMTKSLATSVFWHAWEWARDPSIKWLTTSHRGDLSIRDNVRARRLIESPWYRLRYPKVALHGDQNQKMRYETTAGGYRLASSFGGTATGDGGQRRVVDDPHNASDVMSDVQRHADLEWWRLTWSTRTIDITTDADVVIMQRLHEQDLSGFLLTEIGGYEHLMLPMRYDPDRRCKTRLGRPDPRRRRGQLLDPVRFPEREVRELEKALGPYGAAGQLQQQPVPAGGGILKDWWFGYWVDKGWEHLPPVKVKDADGNLVEIQARLKPPSVDADRQLQSWDMAFKGTSGSSRVAGQVWEQHDADAYLLANDADRRSFTGTVAAVRRLSEAWPRAYSKVVEAKANGPAVVDVLRSELGGFYEAEPYGSKEARMHAITPRVAAGNVLLPHPQMPGYTWVTGLRQRLTQFPSGQSNDEADAFSQALMALPGPGQRYEPGAQPRRSERVTNPRRR